MRSLLPTVLLVSFFLGACASASGNGSDGPEVRRDRNRIALEELQGEPSGTAFNAVQHLRPAWLRGRPTSLGGTTITSPRVFVNGSDYGTAESLRSIDIESVSEMEYMSGQDATTRYGTGYPLGIILVRLKL
jgi:hypothetical protein